MKKIWISTSAALALLPAIASAQGAPAPATATPAQAEGLQDIVVTAQKREEKLSAVPISVSVLGGADLAKRGIDSTKDLALVTPSLVTNELASFNQTFLRGVGTDIQAPGAEAGVANYIDGVYAPFASSQLTGLLGTERTEVLFGPQGTLYGRNTVGGAINIVTLTPSQTARSSITATYGNYDRTDLTGYISGGVATNLALGFYGGFTRRDTFLDFVNRPDRTRKHEVSYAGRMKFVATPDETLRITGTAEYTRSTGSEGVVFRQLQEDATGFLLTPKFIEYNKIVANSPARQTVWQARGVLQIDKEIGEVDLVSISAYQRFSQDGIIDVDGTEADLVAARQVLPKMSDISQELRLQSASSSTIQWVVGLYYAANRQGFRPNTTFLLSGVTPNPVQSEVTTRIHGRSLAAFGQATAPIGGGFSLTLGARYSDDRKKFRDAQVITRDSASGDVLADAQFPDDSKSWSAFTPKATLSYKNGDLLIYATYSKGYKSGQYPMANPGDAAPVNPEKLTNIEGGIKANLLKNRVSINANVFHYDYKDLQVYFVRITNGVLASSLLNAASAEIWGGDLSVNALLFDGFTLSGSAAYNHSEYTSFPAYAAAVPGPGGNVTQPVNAKGNPVQRTPKWTTSLNANYEYELNGGGTFNANALWSYNSGFAWDPSNFYRQKSYHVVNASIGYTLPSKKVTISAFATNLFDEEYERIEFAYTLGRFGQDAAPRMYGLTVSIKN